MTDEENNFISSNRRTVHRGTREHGPDCGTQQKGEWATVDADTAEEAVMDYNLVPCTRCISNSMKLDLWRRDIFSATVIHSADTPEKWKRKYDDFYTGETA